MHDRCEVKAFVDEANAELRVGYVKLTPDDTAENPRKWDNLGRLALLHSRYDFPFAVPDGTPRASMTQEEIVRLVNPDLLLPVYLYDHSARVFSHLRFPCQWDSSMIGWHYCCGLEKEYPGLSKDERIRVAEGCLKRELNAYEAWAEGQVKTGEILALDGESLDCRGGLYTYDDRLALCQDSVPTLLAYARERLSWHVHLSSPRGNRTTVGFGATAAEASSNCAATEDERCLGITKIVQLGQTALWRDLA